MTKDEALKLALEALEELTDIEQTYEALERGDIALTAIKEALAEPEHIEDSLTMVVQPEQGLFVGMIAKLPGLAEELAQAEQRQPLTDQLINEIYQEATCQSLRPQDYKLAREFARAIEAAHGIKEKNHGAN